MLEGLNFWFLGPSLQGPSFLYNTAFSELLLVFCLFSHYVCRLAGEMEGSTSREVVGLSWLSNDAKTSKFGNQGTSPAEGYR